MSASGRTRVLVVGADPSGEGWGARAHIPAIQAQSTLELSAVCTSRPDTAERAAARWRAPRWFSDYEDAVRDPAVDLVTIAVRVGLHEQIAGAAVEAGKPVYCEWPLTLTADGAQRLAELSVDVPTAVGLQARFSPAIRYARELLDGGALGRPLTFVATQTLSRFAVASDRSWLAHDDQGSGALNVATGHVLDTVEYLLAPVEAISGTAATLAPEDTYSDTGETFRWTAADTVAAVACLASGAVGSVYATYLADPVGGFSLDVFCDGGRLSLRAAGYLSYTPCVLKVAKKGAKLRTVNVPARRRRGACDEEHPAANLGYGLAAFAEAMRTGERFRPDFADAARLHLILERIKAARPTPLTCG